jgi:hypothetical protein
MPPPSHAVVRVNLRTKPSYRFTDYNRPSTNQFPIRYGPRHRSPAAQRGDAVSGGMQSAVVLLLLVRIGAGYCNSKLLS